MLRSPHPVAFLVALCAACAGDRSVDGAPPATATAPSAAGRDIPVLASPLDASSAGGVPHAELRLGGASPDAQELVVVLHAQHGTPATTALALDQAPRRGRVWLPEGAVRSGDGFAWLDAPLNARNRGVPEQLDAAADRLATWLRLRAPGRRLPVVGVGEGGAVAVHLAVRHPDVAGPVTAIAADYPSHVAAAAGLAPGGAPRPDVGPLRFLIGEGDPAYGVDAVRAAADALAAAGLTASVEVQPGQLGQLPAPTVDAMLAEAGLPPGTPAARPRPVGPDGEPVDPADPSLQLRPGPDGVPSGPPTATAAPATPRGPDATVPSTVPPPVFPDAVPGPDEGGDVPAAPPAAPPPVMGPE